MTLRDLYLTQASGSEGCCFRLVESYEGESHWVQGADKELIMPLTTQSDIIFYGEWRNEPGRVTDHQWRMQLYLQPKPDQWLMYHVQIPSPKTNPKSTSADWSEQVVRIHPRQLVANITQGLLNDLSKKGIHFLGAVRLTKHFLREDVVSTDHMLDEMSSLTEQECNEGNTHDYRLRLVWNPEQTVLESTLAPHHFRVQEEQDTQATQVPAPGPHEPATIEMQVDEDDGEMDCSGQDEEVRQMGWRTCRWWMCPCSKRR